MKKLFLIFVLLLVFASPCSAYWFGPETKPLSANIYEIRGNTEKLQSKTYFDGQNIRMDMQDEDKEKMSTIFRSDLKKLWTVMHSEKSYLEMDMDPDDPMLKELAPSPDEIKKTKLGNETVNGFKCTKYKLQSYNKILEREMTSIGWYSPRVGTYIRLQMEDGTVTEMRNIKLHRPPIQRFEIPKGYEKMTFGDRIKRKPSGKTKPALPESSLNLEREEQPDMNELMKQFADIKDKMGLKEGDIPQPPQQGQVPQMKIPVQAQPPIVDKQLPAAAGKKKPLVAVRKKKPTSKELGGTQYEPRDLLFPNSDFEDGSLAGWEATGNAFTFQPTLQDNPTARGRGQPSRHQGSYWIGTFEKYNETSGTRPGTTQNDRPTGTLASQPFIIDGEKIGFLVGGGGNAQKIYVALLVNGREVRKATGQNSETMRMAFWDVKPFVGKQAQIVIADLENGGWGHINADFFHYDRPPSHAGGVSGTPLIGGEQATQPTTQPVDDLLFANSDFERGTLEGWSALGNAFTSQPVEDDNVKRRTKTQSSNHQGTYWVGTYEKYNSTIGTKRGTSQGDKPTGTLQSAPFTIRGEKISFLIAGGRAPAQLYVALLVNGSEMRKATGHNNPSMRKIVWNVEDLQGTEAQIVICDFSAQVNGYISADFFHYEGQTLAVEEQPIQLEQEYGGAAGGGDPSYFQEPVTEQPGGQFDTWFPKALTGWTADETQLIDLPAQDGGVEMRQVIKKYRRINDNKVLEILVIVMPGRQGGEEGNIAEAMGQLLQTLSGGKLQTVSQQGYQGILTEESGSTSVIFSMENGKVNLTMDAEDKPAVLSYCRLLNLSTAMNFFTPQ